MTSVLEYARTQCGTAGIRPLNKQILEQLPQAVRDKLESCADIVTVQGNSTLPMLQSAARAALARAVEAHHGEKPVLIHALRTLAQQYVLHYWKVNKPECGIRKAAPPGNSMHEQGLAIDVEEYQHWKAALTENDWEWFGLGDRGHFTYVGPGIIPGVAVECISAFQRLWNLHNPGDLIQVDGLYGEVETGPRLARSPVEGFPAL